MNFTTWQGILLLILLFTESKTVFSKLNSEKEMDATTDRWKRSIKHIIGKSNISKIRQPSQQVSQNQHFTFSYSLEVCKVKTHSSSKTIKFKHPRLLGIQCQSWNICQMNSKWENNVGASWIKYLHFNKLKRANLQFIKFCLVFGNETWIFCFFCMHFKSSLHLKQPESISTEKNELRIWLSLQLNIFETFIKTIPIVQIIVPAPELIVPTRSFRFSRSLLYWARFEYTDPSVTLHR